MVEVRYPHVAEEHHSTNIPGKGVNRVTISEAATLLGVHPNTVRNRVKDGSYQAEKIVTGHGPTWYIDRDSLVTNTPPSGLQFRPTHIVNKEALEVVQDLLRPFVEDLGKVREELGAERVRREQAERERDELATRLAELEQAPEPLEGDPETVTSASTEEGQGVETPLRQEHRPWWRRWFGS